MSGLKVLAATVLLASLLATSAAQAMDIVQFDKMDDRDQAAYVGLLVQGTIELLTHEGRTDLATQIHDLIVTIPAGDKMSVGMTEFERNLALARDADAERAAKDSNARRVAAEDAWLITVKKNNIPLSQDFVKGVRTINSNFRPKYPPQQ